MKYLLALLLSVGVMTAQDNPLRPMKKLVVGGNEAVTLGQVVAGYRNNFHIGIRPPFRQIVVSIDEGESPLKLAYPNPTKNGEVNLEVSSLKSVRVTDIFGTIVYDFQNISGANGIVHFELPSRGTYFMNVITVTDDDQSTILIFQ